MKENHMDEHVEHDGAGDGEQGEGPVEPIEGQELETSGEIEGDGFTEPGIGETSDGETSADAESETTEGDVETGDAGDGEAGDAGDETGETDEPAEEETAADGDAKPSNEILQELHDDIEAALFASQDLPHGREQAVIVAKLESALTWTKKALDKS